MLKLLSVLPSPISRPTPSTGMAISGKRRHHESVGMALAPLKKFGDRDMFLRILKEKSEAILKTRAAIISSSKDNDIDSRLFRALEATSLGPHSMALCLRNAVDDLARTSNAKILGLRKSEYAVTVNKKDVRFDRKKNRLVQNSHRKYHFFPAKCARLHVIAEVMLVLCQRGVRLDINSLHYMFPGLNVTDKTIREYVNDVCRFAGCTWESTGLYAHSEGYVGGMLIFQAEGISFNCDDCPIAGVPIPDRVETVGTCYID